jgi:hypothetical protein
MPPRLFFCFILLNAAAQSAAGSYLQTAVVAVASLFGPAAMQAVMAGQAVVAVAVSGVQVVSAIASTWGKARTSTSDRTPEEGSAFFFFTLSTLFVFASAIAHNWLVNSSTYKAVAAPLEQRAIKRLPSSIDSSPEPLLPRGKNEADDDWRQAVRLAKANITYEIAVAYIFVITLVCAFSRGMKQSPYHILLFPPRPSSPPSLPPFCPSTLKRIPYCSPASTSSCSTLEISLVDTAAHFPFSLSGLGSVFSCSHLLGPSSFPSF